VSSAGYLINDIHDINSDKRHKLKKNRPLAKNEISVSTALIIFFLFLTLSFYLALFLSLYFFYIIVFYLAYSICYTFFLKRTPIFDIFFLSIFYCIRIFSGTLIMEEVVTSWLVFFSFMLFSYLSSLKKLIDNKYLNKNSYYNKSDIKLLKIVAPSLFIATILLFINYLTVNSRLVHNPFIGYLIFLILIFWGIHMLRQVFLNNINSDPIWFVLKDKNSYILFFILTILLFFNFFLKIK
jgi:4-hydroxybenzoate polyprenyltransferase